MNCFIIEYIGQVWVASPMACWFYSWHVVSLWVPPKRGWANTMYPVQKHKYKNLVEAICPYAHSVKLPPAILPIRRPSGKRQFAG